MSRKVRINEDECIGCGSCADMCPDVFEMNHELEKSFVIKPEGGDEDCIMDAMGEGQFADHVIGPHCVDRTRDQ